MKVKFLPDDFVVDEQIQLEPSTDGRFSFYRLTKRGWTTPDAVQAIARKWKIPGKAISYGGLKDRHAVTMQYLTIQNGPRKDLEHLGIRLEFLGYLPHPFRSELIESNRFQLILRDMKPHEINGATQAIHEMQSLGVANYFDDQRFGSVGRDREFIAKFWVLGDYESGLKLALAGEYEHDRADAKAEKEVLRSHWGNWKECKANLGKSHARSLVSYLIDHPTDFKGAVERLRPELQGLYLSAYQSHLWNRMLDAWIESNSISSRKLKLKLGEFATPAEMAPEQAARWEQFELPLPSARLKLHEDDPFLKLIEPIFASEGYPLSEMRLRGLQRPFFSKGVRTARIQPQKLEWRVEPDDRHPGKEQLKLSFELIRGAYATMIIKRLSIPHLA